MNELIKLKICENYKESAQQVDWPLFLQEALLDKSKFALELQSEQKLCNLCDYLYFFEGKLFFHSSELGEMSFDFEGPWLYHQRQRYALSKEPLAKALGIKGNSTLKIWDTTCGSGKDTLLIHYFKAELRSFERHPAVYLLLQDALRRFPLPISIEFADASRINNQEIESNPPDVIYYDPMYPEKSGSKKSALPRKEMRIFKQLVGEDLDSAQFLEWAKSVARERVVVKRALGADPIAPHPTASYEGKSTRYDMYKVF